CSDWASVEIISVLARPGTPTSSAWLRVKIEIRISSITCSWPTITLLSSDLIAAWAALRFSTAWRSASAMGWGRGTAGGGAGCGVAGCGAAGCGGACGGCCGGAGVLAMKCPFQRLGTGRFPCNTPRCGRVLNVPAARQPYDAQEDGILGAARRASTQPTS